jgi:hypothetical protein
MEWEAEDADATNNLKTRITTMTHKIFAQKALHVFASGLSMAAQRLPFLKTLTPLLTAGPGGQFAAPIVISFIGIDRLSGASPTVSPVDGYTNPATANVGETFVWLFRTKGETAKSFDISPLPPGLTYTFGSPVSSITGTPTVGGSFAIQIVGWEEKNQRGKHTPTYTFNLTINQPATPLEIWTESFWTGNDLSNPDISGPNADPDRDGIENLLEFVFNLDPTKKESFPGTFGTDPTDDTLLIYTLPFNSGAGEMIKFQESSTLKSSNWIDIDPATSETEITTTAGSISLKIPKASAARKMIRVVATIPT